MPKIPRFVAVLALAGAALALGAAPVSARPQNVQDPAADLHGHLMAIADHPAPAATPTRGPILFRGSASVLALVHELERLSSSAARMLAALRKHGVPVIFGTFEDMAPVVRSAFHAYDPGRTRALGYMAPRTHVHPESGGLGTEEILVGLNLTRLEDLFHDRPRPSAAEAGGWDHIQRLETLALLAHEVAHAYGLVVSGGDPRLGCPDPAEGELPETACVVIAENLIRRELGAPLDWGYGMPSVETLLERYEEFADRREAFRSIEEQTSAWTRSLPREGFPEISGIARARTSVHTATGR